jgi:glyoxylase-like metal-dependent hydrolase (beta-lactamase superfamily II)
MQIGDYLISPVEMGRFRLDGGAMFGVVPKVMWQKTNPSDDRNRIDMALRGLLVRGKGRVILVDCGIGTKWNEKQIDMYAIDHSTQDLDRSLAALGVTRDDVTDLVLTHLHFDHVGGATRFDSEGKVVLTFPNANYYVQERNLSHAHAPTAKDRASFVEQTIQPVEQSGRFKILDGERGLLPGVHVLVTQGHTPGHQLLRVRSNDEAILFCGDTIPTSSHIPIPYVMAYDLMPLTTMDEKKQILEQAVKEKWALCFPHDPLIAATRVIEKDGRYERGEVVRF